MGIKEIIIRELKEHWPLALVASLIAGVLVGILFLIDQTSVNIYVLSLFEILHPAHLFVSAAASAAIYNKCRGSFIWSVIIGILAAISVGSLSDVFLPFVFGNLFSFETEFHLPIIEEPLLILFVVLVGAVFGALVGLFRMNHSLHVFLSVFASLFYLMSFSSGLNMCGIIASIIVVFLVVYIPCCISDIVFPLLFVRGKCNGELHGHH